jgi:hypothetical protein
MSKTEMALHELLDAIREKHKSARRELKAFKADMTKETARANVAEAELDALKKTLGMAIRLRDYPEIWKVLDEVHRTIIVAAESGSAVVYDLKITLPAYSPDEVKLDVERRAHAIATQESLDKMTRQLGLLRESIECLSNESAYAAEKLKEMRTAMKGQG